MMIGANAVAIILEVGYIHGDTAVVIVHAMQAREVPELISDATKC